MDALRCPPRIRRWTSFPAERSRRVALCRLLIQEPDILLLDEPTNHLDAETVQWLEQHLKRYPGTVIAVTHDRYFLDNVAGWILELDRGYGIPFEGNYTSWLEQKKERLANEEKAETKRQKTLEHELEWIRMAPRARQAKSKARVARYEELLSAEHEKASEDLEIYIPPGPRLGKLVLEAENLTKAFEDRDPHRRPFVPGAARRHRGSHRPERRGEDDAPPDDCGRRTPDGGSLRLGDTVKLGYVDQDRTLDGEKSVFDVISDGHDIRASSENARCRPGLTLPASTSAAPTSRSG